MTEEQEVQQALEEFDPSPPAEPNRQRDPETGRFTSQVPDEPTEQPVQPETPKHSAAMVRLAHGFGMSDEEIADHTPDQLEMTIAQLQKQLVNETRQQRLIEQPRRPEPQPEQDPALPYDPADVHEGINGAIRTLLKEQKALKDQLATLKERNEQFEAASQARRLDRAFQKHADYFGTQAHDEFDDAEDIHLLRRQSALAIMKVDKSNRSLEAKVARAMKIMGGTPAATAAPDAAADVLEQRRRDFAEGALAPPTQRAPAPEKPGLHAAKKAYVAGLRQAGLPVNGSLPEEDFQP